MSDPAEWNPVQIAAAIRAATDRLENSAKAIRDSREVFLKAKRSYVLAKAAKRQDAKQVSEGRAPSYDDRDDMATIATHQEWLDMDTADVAHSYSRDLANALEKKVSGLQTEAKLIMQAYNTSNH